MRMRCVGAGENLLNQRFHTRSRVRVRPGENLLNQQSHRTYTLATLRLLTIVLLQCINNDNNCRNGQCGHVK